MAKKIIVVGGGASGILAAISAAQSGAEVFLLEKNEKLGKKLYITGKGRCNVTNLCDREEFFEQICTNSKFMYSSFSNFDNYELMGMLEESGCPLCVQRGNRVFPKTEKSVDVIKALSRKLEALHIKVELNTRVKGLRVSNAGCIGVKLENKDLESDAVIVSTGGLSYPSTGSTGDGIEWAKKLGLNLVKCRPSLVPIETKETYVKELQGLSLKNIKFSVFFQNKILYSEQGEMLFTHFGISGPLILRASSVVGERIFGGEMLRSEIDFKPALTHQQLDTRILRDFSKNINKYFINSLGALFPKKLIPIMVRLSGISEYKEVNKVTVKERKRLVDLTKSFPLTLNALRGYNEAVITSGGIDVKEINPRTMECKKIKNLYFTGEVLDIDAMTGGFNLQLAFSSGYTAGIYAAGMTKE